MSGSEEEFDENSDEFDHSELESDEDPDESAGESESASNIKSGAIGDLNFANPPSYAIVKDANGNERYEYHEIDPIYDSDDSDAQGPINTIGNIPLSFYDSYPHIGYDINGKRIMRPAAGEALDALLDSIELPKGWTGLTDPETGKPLNLTQDELEILKRVQLQQLPEDGYDPYPVSSLDICLWPNR